MDKDDFEPVVPGLWELFNMRVSQMREAPDQASLAKLLVQCREQLDGIEEEYRSFHKNSVSASYAHPRVVSAEMRRFLRLLCRQFQLLPPIYLDPSQAAAGDNPNEPNFHEGGGVAEGDDGAPRRVGVLDGFEEEGRLERAALARAEAAAAAKAKEEARFKTSDEAGEAEDGEWGRGRGGRRGRGGGRGGG